jgi:hypothetical protein
MEQEHNLEQLKNRLAEINDINRTIGLLGWDQQTYMPPAGTGIVGTAGFPSADCPPKLFPRNGRLLDELHVCHPARPGLI